MGIKKLTTFIKNQPKEAYFRPLNLQHSSNKAVVIDGYSLCYRLHFDIESGNYCEFYDHVRDYFQTLESKGIIPYVVVDGVDFEGRKLKTDKERCEHRIKALAKCESQVCHLPEMVLPFMAKVVFVDAIRDMQGNTQLLVADGEGERDAVALANYLRCPVMGLDSDLFVFNIEAGYIPITGHGTSRRLIDLTGEVQCFHYQLFDERHRLTCRFVRTVLPHCLGNDFHGARSLPALCIWNDDINVEAVLSKLSGVFLDDISHQLKDEDRGFYMVEPQSLRQLQASRVLCEYNPSTPEWITQRFKNGRFFPTLMNALVSREKCFMHLLMIEDMMQLSAWTVAASSLPCIAGALLSHEANPQLLQIHQIVRVGENLTEKDIELLDEHRAILAPYDLRNVHEVDQDERKKLLLKVFGCKSKLLRKVPHGLELAVIACHSWLRNIKDDIDHHFEAFILALALCIQTSFSTWHEPLQDDRHRRGNRMSRLNRIHYLAKWECTLYCVMAFNQILNELFPYTSLGRLFSAHVFEKFFVDIIPEELLERLDQDTGMVIFDILKKDIPPPPAQVQRPVVPTQNRFASLSISNS